MKKSVLFYGFVLFAFSTTAQTLIKGKIFNMQGPNAASWDLVDNKQQFITAKADHKDLVNITDSLDLPAFKKTFKSYNSTHFVKVENIVAPTYASLESTFNAGKYTSSIENTKVGDIYVAKIRETKSFAL